MDQISDSPMSQRAYARRRGCTAMAVNVAIKAGRLRESVVWDANGVGKIKDPDLADREWEANTSHDHRERALGTPDVAVSVPTDGPSAAKGMTRSEADTIVAVWKAKRAELEFKEAAGELVPVKDVSRKIADDYAIVRTRLLALPARCKQDLPHLSLGDVSVLEERIREALEELAGPDDE